MTGTADRAAAATRSSRRLQRHYTYPVVAIVVWAVNFYAWHTPYLYQAALRHDALHALEHATFLAFGMAVYMALLGPLPKPAWFNNAARLVYIVAMRLTGTVLANILVFGGTVFYPIYHVGGRPPGTSAPPPIRWRPGGLMMVEERLPHHRAVLLAVPARSPARTRSVRRCWTSPASTGSSSTPSARGVRWPRDAAMSSGSGCGRPAGEAGGSASRPRPPRGSSAARALTASTSPPSTGS